MALVQFLPVRVFLFHISQEARITLEMISVHIYALLFFLNNFAFKTPQNLESLRFAYKIIVLCSGKQNIAIKTERNVKDLLKSNSLDINIALMSSCSESSRKM